MSQNDQPTTKQAGIIVTFYGRRGKMQELQTKTGKALKLIKANYGFQDMSDPYRKIFLRPFDPPPAHDTTVVQLALSESDITQPDEAKKVWPTMRGELEQVLKKVTGKANQASKALFWGYSVIYYATLVDGVSLDEETRENLFQLARRPDSPPPDKSQPKPESLAHTNVSDCCDLWLMDIADEGDGIQAATIYVALSDPDKGKEMRTKVLYGAGAHLLMPDLIAHKSYHQKRQYTHNPQDPKKPLRTLYKEKVDELHHIIEPFLGLGSITSTTPEHEGKPLDLGDLKFVYGQVLSATSNLDELRRSLSQQLKNYQWWRNKLGQGNLTTYHYQQIETAKEELDLLIDKGRWMLDAARTTIEMVQTEQNQAREERENKMGGCLTILGVALAVSQIVDSQAAKAILDLLNYYIPWWSLSSGSRLVQLCVQFLVTALVTVVIYAAYQKVRSNVSR